MFCIVCAKNGKVKGIAKRARFGPSVAKIISLREKEKAVICAVSGFGVLSSCGADIVGKSGYAPVQGH
jgi:uncharacterized Zn ribbon protein